MAKKTRSRTLTQASTNKSIYAIIIIALLFGFFLGFVIGEHAALVYALKVANSFVSIDFDEKKIAYAMYQYENNIKTCYGEQFIK